MLDRRKQWQRKLRLRKLRWVRKAHFRHLKKVIKDSLKGNQTEKDLLSQVKATATGQYPFAAIISCLDSRVSAEMIFDQGVGDVFSGRVAGNIVNVDLLGSLEFACKLAGTKLIIVMGHTACGAVKGAADGVELGNLTELLSKIKPAIEAVTEPAESEKRNSSNAEFVNAVARKNVGLTVENVAFVESGAESNGRSGRD